VFFSVENSREVRYITPLTGENQTLYSCDAVPRRQVLTKCSKTEQAHKVLCAK